MCCCSTTVKEQKSERVKTSETGSTRSLSMLSVLNIPGFAGTGWLRPRCGQSDPVEWGVARGNP